MHALNNYLGGPYVTQDACRRAADQVRMQLGPTGGAASEHLDPETGYLSIDVINLLGSSILGLHVEAVAAAWEDLQAEDGGAALVNWHQEHWTVLHRERAHRDGCTAIASRTGADDAMAGRRR